MPAAWSLQRRTQSTGVLSGLRCCCSYPGTNGTTESAAICALHRGANHRADSVAVDTALHSVAHAAVRSPSQTEAVRHRHHSPPNFVRRTPSVVVPSLRPRRSFVAQTASIGGHHCAWHSHAARRTHNWHLRNSACLASDMEHRAHGLHHAMRGIPCSARLLAPATCEQRTAMRDGRRCRRPSTSGSPTRLPTPSPTDDPTRGCAPCVLSECERFPAMIHGALSCARTRIRAQEGCRGSEIQSLRAASLAAMEARRQIHTRKGAGRQWLGTRLRGCKSTTCSRCL
jgi:hypothetical protein